MIQNDNDRNDSIIDWGLRDVKGIEEKVQMQLSPP